MSPPHSYQGVCPDGRELITTQMYFSGGEEIADVKVAPDLLINYLTLMRTTANGCCSTLSTVTTCKQILISGCLVIETAEFNYLYFESGNYLIYVFNTLQIANPTQ